MLLYSKSAQHALRAVSYITQNAPKTCGIDEIIQHEDIPKFFLPKLLKHLVRGKVLLSNRGPGGGYSLNGKPEDFTLYDIVSVIDNMDENFVSCALGWSECSDKNPCGLHHSYKVIRKQVEEYLTKTTLANFAEAEKAKKKRPRKKQKVNK